MTALEIAQRRMAQAEKNRGRYPLTAEAIDYWRAQGFTDCSLVATDELGGRGTFTGPGVVPCTDHRKRRK